MTPLERSACSRVEKILIAEFADQPMGITNLGRMRDRAHELLADQGVNALTIGFDEGALRRGEIRIARISDFAPKGQ